MFNVIILHGSSCVGKSFTMKKMEDSYLKLEMDKAGYSLLNGNEEKRNKCFTLLMDTIKNNNSNKDMVVTCGYLPPPHILDLTGVGVDPSPNSYYKIYKKMEVDYGITIKHILVLVKDKDTYIKYIKNKANPKNDKSNDWMEKKINDSFRNYKWRENNKSLYDSILFNDTIDETSFKSKN